jgi:hypothetical protein
VLQVYVINKELDFKYEFLDFFAVEFCDEFVYWMRIDGAIIEFNSKKVSINIA